MAGRQVLLAFASLLYGCAAVSAESKCGPIGEAADDVAIHRVKVAFVEHTEGKVKQYKISSQDCGSTIRLFFEAIGKDANFGQHWLVHYDKATGAIQISDGM